MSILATQPEAPVVELTPAELHQQRLAAMAKRNAEAAIRYAVSGTDALVNNLIIGIDAIWASEDPAAVLAEIGTDAVELFAMSRDVAAFLIPQLTGKRDDQVDAINAAFGRMLPYTENADGTVTIDE
jgi:hypothetical protein